MLKTVNSFDGTKINYDISRKSDKFLIFIHGAGGNLRAWDKIRNHFNNMGFSTIAVDLRGHGLSGRPKLLKDYELNNFAHDLNAVIKKEKIKKAILIGHCFGGPIAMLFDSLYPNMVDGYVFLNSFHKAPDKFSKTFNRAKPLIFLFNKIFEKEDLSKKEFKYFSYDEKLSTANWGLGRMYKDLRLTSAKTWLFTLVNMADFEGREILKNIKKPVLIVGSEFDTVVGLDPSYEIKKLIKHARLNIVKNGNHIIVLNDPAFVEKELTKFLEYSGINKKWQK